ncbi:uncharacterized protein VTP21DRAFT_7539 [Calcarisporiella thermophila]|uniref:uncharacterized protein n=1 Tax=Calcarisporiella thermophila TaxID=911321 RepID=UPI00374495A9
MAPKSKAIALALALCSVCSASSSPVQFTFPGEQEVLTYGRLTNIMLDYDPSFQGALSFDFAPCGSSNRSNHELIGKAVASEDDQPNKFVWKIPENAITEGDQCVQVYDGVDTLLAQSQPLHIGQDLSKRDLPFGYYDASAHYVKRHDKFVADHKKKKKVGIVGAGMAGLFSGLLLESVGIPVEILEGNDRVGGRVYTYDFGDGEFQYGELGAMRIPYTAKDGNQTVRIREHKIIFDLIDYLNKNWAKSNRDKQLEVIDFFTPGPNHYNYFYGGKTADGRIPTNADVAKNPRVSGAPKELFRDGSADDLWIKAFTMHWPRLFSDFYKARDEFAKEKEDGHSIVTYMRNVLGYGADQVDLVDSLVRWTAHSNIGYIDMLLETVMFRANGYKTINHGMNRLPRAIASLLGKKVHLNSKVRKIKTKDGKVMIGYKKNKQGGYTYRNYDYSIITAPFSIVRNWEIPKFSWYLYRAIWGTPYQHSCKVFMQFSKRFWEEGERPLKGGCSRTDMTNKMTCYPSQDPGGKGKAVLLASYTVAEDARPIESMADDQLVERMLDNLSELHGRKVHKLFTGKWVRHCFNNDEFSAGAWAGFQPGQHELYIPAMHNVEHNIVFAGEHTHILHGWITSAVSSAGRAVVQLLVEMGHIDLAKKIKKEWDLYFVHI